MKHLVLIFLAIVGAYSSLQAQSIRFEKDSLTHVFVRAWQLKKPVFVLLTAPPSPAGPSAMLRKSGSESELFAPAVVALLNKEFLNKELQYGTAEIAAVVRKYTVSRYPTCLYFGVDGSLLYRSTGSASNEQRYLQDLRAFRQAQADPQNLSYYHTQFQQGNRSVSFLQQYLDKCQQMGQLVAPDLLDAYVKQLPAHAFDRAAEVVFVLGHGPVVGSNAYQLTRRNPRLYDSLYRAWPLAQRIAINNLMISNTMAQAIATKDRKLAMQGADFARRTWSSNAVRGARAFEDNMLGFYSSTQDTSNYLRSATSFYERYYMAVSADSAKKVVAAVQAYRQEQRASLQRLANPIAKPAGAKIRANGTYVVQQRFTIGPPNSFLLELNNGAKAIYQTGTRNSQYLQQALQWSKRTVNLDPISYNFDMLAHLLYRLRFFSEAEVVQQQAVAAARQEKEPVAPYELELEKIKKRTL